MKALLTENLGLSFYISLAEHAPNLSKESNHHWTDEANEEKS